MAEVLDALFDDGDVGVWCAPTPDDELALADAERLLSAEERQRADRFVRPRDRVDFVASHALVRRALSAVGGRQPHEWQFAVGPHGRPFLVESQREDLDFNLSHTRGFSACAIGRRMRVGIDVERAPSGRAVHDIARRFFDAAEARVLAGMGNDEAERHFLEMWTLKEAYVKATGIGLTQPQPSFATLRTTGTVRLPEDATGAWRFWLCAAGHGITLAVAASAENSTAAPRLRFIEPPLPAADVVRWTGDASRAPETPHVV